ncbi:MAG TPA: hypothetical protein VGM14_08260 [Streptosporangiaceae bacterium]
MDVLLNFDNEVALSSADPQYALTTNSISPVMLGQYNDSTENQKADISEFGNFATASQATMLGQALAALSCWSCCFRWV